MSAPAEYAPFTYASMQDFVANNPHIDHPYRRLFHADGLAGIDLARWLIEAHPTFSDIVTYTLKEKTFIWECNPWGIWVQRGGTDDMQTAIGVSIRGNIQRHFIDHLDAYVRSSAGPRPDISAELALRLEAARKLHGRLNMRNVRNDLVRDVLALRSQSTDVKELNRFLGRLDKKTKSAEVLGFDDGVFCAAKRGLLHPRDAERHYVSKTVGFEYAQVLAVTPASTAALHAFLRQVIPSDAVRSYYLKLLSLALVCGHNPAQKFVMMRGAKAANGKSTLKTLIAAAFGDYAKDANNGVLFKDLATGVNEEMVDLDKARCIFFSEPDQCSKLHPTPFKTLSSNNDKIQIRGLYQSCRPLECRFLPLMLCNALPEMRVFDEGCRRRVVVVPFESKFTERPEEVDEAAHVYARDNELDVSDLAPAFVALLIEYLDVPLPAPPAEVTVCTEEYAAEQDNVASFIAAKLERTDLPYDRITLKDLWAKFRVYCAVNNKRCVEKMKNFKERMLAFAPVFVAASNGQCNIFGGIRWVDSDDDQPGVCEV